MVTIARFKMARGKRKEAVLETVWGPVPAPRRVRRTPIAIATTATAATTTTTTTPPPRP